MASLQDAVMLISSEKAGDRAIGIEQYKNIFSDDATLSRISQNGDGERRWLRTMQALFNCVLADRSACTRKGSWRSAAHVSKKRLQDSAGMVLWMIERAHTLFEKQCLASAVNHITQVLDYHGELMEPVAVYYLKALRVLLSYTPHQDHIDADLWRHAAQMCLSIVLGDPLGEEVSLDDAQKQARQREAPTTRRLTRPEDLEAMRCLNALTQGQYAPLLGEQRTGATLLFRMASVLMHFPLETSLHLPLVEALNRVMAVLRVNDPDTLLQFAELACPTLVSLWDTKGQALKEQLVIALRNLQPVVVAFEKVKVMRVLLDVILSEASDRLSLQPLAMSHVELCSFYERRPFQYPDVRASRLVSANHLLVWSTLELGADLLVATHLQNDSEEESDMDTPSKRRKQATGRSVQVEEEDPLPALLSSLRNIKVGQATQKQWHLQLLLFVIARHFDALSVDAQKDILQVLMGVIGQDDSTLQSWAFVCLASAASSASFADIFVTAWQAACRLAMRSATCRAACHAAQRIIASGHVARAEVGPRLITMLGELSMQASFDLSDAVCAFLSTALQFASSDVSLSQHGLREKVLVWLRARLSSAGSAMLRPQGDTLLGLEVAEVLLAVCGHDSEAIRLRRRKSPLPPCATATWAEERHAAAPVERFVLAACLDDGLEEKGVSTPREQNGVRRKMTPSETQCSAFLSSLLQAHLLRLEEDDPITLSEAVLLEKIEMVVGCVQFQIELNGAGVKIDQEVSSRVFALLAQILKIFDSLPSLSASRKAAILQRLQPCLPMQVTDRRHQAVRQAGPYSGVRREVLLRSAAVSHSTSSTTDSPLTRFWSDDSASQVIIRLRHLLDSSMVSGNGAGERQNGHAEDVFDSEEVKQHRNGHVGKDDQDVLNRMCLSMLVTSCARRASEAEALKNVSRWVCEETTAEEFVAQGGWLLECAEQAGYHLDDASQNDWMERIGSDVLAEYTHERSIPAQLFAVRFLRTTRPRWATSSTSEEYRDLALQLCLFLMRQSNKKHLHWSVELAFADLMCCSLPDMLHATDSLPKLLQPQVVIKSLCALTDRTDLLIRFPLASLAARLFELWHELGEDVHDLFNWQTASLPRLKHDRSMMSSRIVVLANIAVVNSQLREYALFHMLEVCSLKDTYSAFGRAAMQAVAINLGFPSLKSLWLSFAGRLVWGLVKNKYKLEQISYRLLGYDSRKEWAQDLFMHAAPLLLSTSTPESRKTFSALCDYAVKTERAGTLECLSVLIATKTAELAGGASPEEVRDAVSDFLERLFDAKAKVRISDDEHRERLDSITVELLLTWCEKDMATLAAQLNKLRPEIDTSTYLAKPTVELAAPAWRQHDTEQTLAALAVFATMRVNATSAEVLYNVIHRMGGVIAAEHLLNVQVRLLYALFVYVTVAWSSLNGTPVVMRLFLHVCTELLSQPDLFVMVVPMVCTCLANVDAKTPSVTSVLLQLADKSRQMSMTGDEEIEKASSALFTSLHAAMTKLFGDTAVRGSVINCLCAWPLDIPPDLAAQIGELRLDDISLSLRNVKVVNTLFLQRCLSALKSADDRTVRAFSASDLWTLVEVTKAAGAKRPAESGALGSLLADVIFACEGRLQTPSVSRLQHASQSRGLTSVVRQIAESEKAPTLPLRRWVTLSLLEELRSPVLAESQSTLRTLRAMFSHDRLFVDVKSLKAWPEHALQELHLVNAFGAAAESSGAIRKRHCEELATADSTIGLSESGAWASCFAAFLCELMTTRDYLLAYGQLASLVQQHARIAVKLLPAIVHIFYRTALTRGSDGKKDARAVSKYLLSVLRTGTADPQIWSQIIAIVLQLRIDCPTPTPFSGDAWIDRMDWLLMASRAVDVRLFACASLCLELYEQYRQHPRSALEESQFMELQYAIYSNIDDPDSFYGVKNADMRDALQRRLTHEGHWQRVFEMQAAQAEALGGGGGSGGSEEAIRSSLQQQGFSRLAMRVTADEASLDYEAGWRTEKWDLPMTSEAEHNRSQSLYAALRAVHQDVDVKAAECAVKLGFARSLANMRYVDVEASKETHKAVQELLSLREVDKWVQSKTTFFTPGSRVGDKGGMEFDVLEPLLSVQVSLLRSNQGRVRADDNLLVNIDLDEGQNDRIREVAVLLALSERAREEGKLPLAINATTQAQHRVRRATDNAEIVHMVHAEFANVLWEQKDHAIAIEALGSILATYDKNGVSRVTKRTTSAKRHGQLLARLGEWQATARSHQGNLIVSECFRPALNLLHGAKANNEAADVYYRYAKFAEEQYRALSTSVEAREKEKAVSHGEAELRVLDAERARLASFGKAALEAVERAHRRTAKVLQLDRASLREHEEARDRFRKDAAEMLSRQLMVAEKSNDDVLMRLTALWFENARLDDFSAYVNKLLQKVPSWKFLSVCRQICSRLTKEMPASKGGTVSPSTSTLSSPAFQKGVLDVVRRMAIDHPFHALYPLYALARGSTVDGKPTTRGRGGRASASTIDANPSTQAARSDVATTVINHVRSKSSTPQQQQRILAWQEVCDAGVEWAQVNLEQALPSVFGAKADEKKKLGTIRIPLHLRIAKLADVDVPVITAPLAVDMTCRYKNIVGIACYGERFKTAGGVHLPKITDCIGSDGKVYRQLFKDLDDLRQDAVMQQVFTLVNGLLQHDRRARRRSLHVRTYAVVPLGPRYGLLEYVGNTTTLLEPMYQQYARHCYEGQMTPHEAREALKKAQGSSADVKRAAYDNVCAKMPPVFRFHFLQHYAVPMALLAARINYTRSVATTSIVGHVLGLGDRHSSNILLDRQTGEVVHIDLGVAFDQGRLLPIPELVPFRLTRNVVDGMGLNGVEGVFRGGCEEVLRVLRAGAGVIKTVLEVFRFDPLYDWTQTPVKVIQAQGLLDEEDGVNGSRYVTTAQDEDASRGPQAKEVAELMALRAINSVIDKLSTNLSVEYTVNDLMIRAMDSTNLGSIFYGWQAAL